MEERVNIADFKKEAKRRKWMEWFERKKNDAKDLIYRNKELIVLFGPAALGAVTAGVKAVSKHKSQKKEEQLKDLYCYDRSLGHYWKLRRELTNSEWIEIDKRKQKGERLADILSELKVLK